MKRLLFVGLLDLFGLFPGLSRAQALSASPPVAAPAPTFQFDGQTFTQVSVTPTKTGSMEMYLPAGQTAAHWTCMAAIHHLTTAIADPYAACRDVADAVKRANPDAQVLVINNAPAGAALLDFVTWPVSAAGKPPYLEHDLCHYLKTSGDGLIAFQYARRSYGTEESTLLQNLKADRQRLLPLMSNAQFAPK